MSNKASLTGLVNTQEGSVHYTSKTARDEVVTPIVRNLEKMLKDAACSLHQVEDSNILNHYRFKGLESLIEVVRKTLNQALDKLVFHWPLCGLLYISISTSVGEEPDELVVTSYRFFFFSYTSKNLKQLVEVPALNHVLKLIHSPACLPKT